jgi:hypothetical protein
VTGKELGEAFLAYLHNDAPGGLLDGEGLALLFGSDEFLIDWDGNQLHFPGMEPVGFQVEGDDRVVPDWIAVSNHKGDWEFTPGTGNPFNSSGGILPERNVKDSSGAEKRVVLAMPYWISHQVKNNPALANRIDKAASKGKGWGLF